MGSRNYRFNHLTCSLKCNRANHFSAKLSTDPASVAHLDARPTGDQEVAGSTPPRSATFFVEIDHEIFSTVILFLPLIQEGLLSFSDERMCTILVNRLED